MFVYAQPTPKQSADGLSLGKDSGWQRLTWQGIEVSTDLPVATANGLLRDLLLFKAVLGEYLPEDAQRAELPLQLIMFSRRRDFLRLLRPRHFAAFTQPRLDRTILIIAPAEGMSLRQNLFHEYVHFHLRSHSTGFPVWYDEGMAVFLGETTVSPAQQGQAEVVFGAPDGRQAEVHLPWSRIVSADMPHAWRFPQLSAFYKQSGELARWLHHSAAAGLPDRSDLLDNLHALDVPQLVQETGTQDISKLLRQHRRPVAQVRRRVVVAEPPPPPPWQALDRFAKNRLLGSLALDANPKAGRRMFRQNMKALSGQTSAAAAELRWRTHLDLSRASLRLGQREDAEDYQRLASTFAPSHPDTLIQSAVLASNNCWPSTSAACAPRWASAAEQLRRALQQAPARLDAVYLLGMSELYRGRPGLALNYIRVIHQHLPWVPSVNYHLGESLRLVGDMQARTYLKQARDWSNDALWRQVAERALALLPES